ALSALKSPTRQTPASQLFGKSPARILFKPPPSVEEVLEVGERTYDAIDDSWVETQGQNKAGEGAEEKVTEQEDVVEVGERTFDATDPSWVDTQGDTEKSINDENKGENVKETVVEEKEEEILVGEKTFN